jgi:hypothetical protein
MALLKLNVLFILNIVLYHDNEYIYVFPTICGTIEQTLRKACKL